MNSYLNLQNIVVRYGPAFAAVNDLSFQLDEGKLLCLLGPSGCGKTTTLRVIAGFIRPTSGTVAVAGKDFTRTPAHKRNMGLVFQNYALFPHLSVSENIAFGLRMRKMPGPAIEKRAREMLELVDLGNLGGRMVAQLSGGQQQRVALARALAIQPSVLLLDEPLSNLDALLRIRMRAELKRIQQQFGLTTVFVTHDQEECFAVADEVILLNAGRIEQKGTSREIFDRPANRFVAEFVGFENIFRLPDGREVAVRAEDVVLEKGPFGAGIRFDGDGVRLGGVVELATRKGRGTLLLVQAGEAEFHVLTRDETVHERGEQATLFMMQRNLILL